MSEKSRFTNLKIRLRSTLPEKDMVWPMLKTIGKSQIAKIPGFALEAIATPLLYEELKENPNIVPIGLLGLAIFSLGSMIVAARSLQVGKYNTSVTSTSVNAIINFFAPNHKQANAYIAEIANELIGITVGRNPVAWWSNTESYLNNDINWSIANRISTLPRGLLNLYWNIHSLHNQPKK
ncbi:MAG: hypothetical protein V1922_01925 [bacterium]